MRWFAFDGKLAPLYGGPPFFESWRYQQAIRDLDPRSYDPALLHGKRNPAGNTAGAPIIPERGDLIVVRSGTLKVAHVFLRAVMPQSLDDSASVKQIDGRGLEEAGEAGGRLPGFAPGRLGTGTFDYRWLFFRVTERPRYLLLGRHADGWMLPEARVRVETQAGGVLTLTVEVPGWLPFSYPVRFTASRNGRPIASWRVRAPGLYRLPVPCDAPGTVLLESDQWFQPSALGISADTRTLSYRVTAIDFAEPP